MFKIRATGRCLGCGGKLNSESLCVACANEPPKCSKCGGASNYYEDYEDCAQKEFDKEEAEKEIENKFLEQKYLKESEQEFAPIITQGKGGAWLTVNELEGILLPAVEFIVCSYNGGLVTLPYSPPLDRKIRIPGPHWHAAHIQFKMISGATHIFRCHPKFVDYYLMEFRNIWREHR